jgi:hypothetical protein
LIRDKKGKIRQVHYTVKRFLGRPPDVAACLATAELRQSLYGKAIGRGKKGLDQQQSLIQAWRNRVGELADLIWPDDEVGYERMLNCPPAGVETNWDYPNHCDRPVLCPFCWCRHYTYTAYARLAGFYGLTGPATDIRVSRDPSPLVEVVRHVRLPKRCGARAALKWAKEHRRHLYDDVLGGMTRGCWQLFVIAPPATEGDRWRLEQRALIPLKACVEDIPVLDSTFQVTLHTRITRRVLIGVVGRTCSYPASLMEGPANLTSVLCQRMMGSFSGEPTKRFCRLSVYGALRHRKDAGGSHATDASTGVTAQ